jgi:hypothetical protein
MPIMRAVVTTRPGAAYFALTLVTPTADRVKGVPIAAPLDTPRGEP